MMFSDYGDVKVVAYEPGAAHIFDRVTGRKLGYVLQTFFGNWRPLVEGVQVGPATRYRSEAAEVVRAYRDAYQAKNEAE